MPIFQQGSINTTALIVPDLYVQIVPPAVSLLNGVPTNVLGVVGTAAWGPTNSPTVIGNMAGYASNFGPVQARANDLGTALAIAVQQGAQNFRCVRVTDGTDVAATATVLDGAAAVGVTLTGKYTGSLGNTISATIAAGSAAASWKLILASSAGLPTEIFDNIGAAVGSVAALTGAALWAAFASAVNNGNSIIRGPSQLAVAAVGPSVAAPVAAVRLFAGGTDGVAAITTAVLIGVDTVPRKGMYALRNQGCSVGMLCDLSDTTSFTNQVAFGLSEGIYMVGTTPAGDTPSLCAAAKATAGIDTYAFKYLLGDWIYWLDTVNGITRLVSPQAFVAGLLSNLSPQNSSLNKQLYGIIGTQKSYANQVYASADLQVLAGAGIDVITNPVPGGSYFGCRIGHNASSNPLTGGDNYTRMTNYLAATLNAGMGKFVGLLQTLLVRAQAQATIANFLSALEQQGMIGAVNGGPSFTVQLDANNNPLARVALGYMQADVKVLYLSIIEKFIINMEGSQATVIRTSTSNQ